MYRNSLVFLALILGATISAAGYDASNTNPITPQGGKLIVLQTGGWGQCSNTGEICLCKECIKNLDRITYSAFCGEENAGVHANSYNSAAASMVDNLSLNHLHWASDYGIESSGGGCSPCGGSASAQNDLPTFSLVRFHQYRDVSRDSSFGPGVYCNFDHKLYLNTDANGQTSIDLIDPTNFNRQRFIDGPYTHPFNPSDTKDGIYVSFKTHSHKDLRLYDSSGNLATNQANATSAILTSWKGSKYYFQIVSIDGTRVGRITKMEDRNGYAITLTYKYQPTDDLMGSEARLWQIDTVTDAHGKVATFSYLATQVSGRWVVSSIAMPNGTSVSYSYTDGYLSGVQLPDGTTSTITRAYDADSNTTEVSYFDAAASGTHRNKKSYLSTNFTLQPDQPDDIFPTSAQLVRMVVNGNNEVAYLNIPDPLYTRVWVFEGNGLLKQVYCNWDVKYAASWSISDAGGPFAYSSVSASLESNFEHLEFSSANSYQSWYLSQPTFRTDPTGRRRDFEYNAATHVSKITYPDATFETFAYNGFEEVTQHVDRLSRVTEYTYDTRGNMLTKTVGKILVAGVPTATPETATWNWEYFPSGDTNPFLLKSSTDANGNVTDYEYDSNHFLVKIKDPADNAGDPRAETLFAYDSTGRLVSMTDPELRVTTHEYDARNRVTKITYNDATFETLAYGSGADANLLVSQADRLGNTTTYSYDASGRQTQRVTAANDSANSAIFACTYRVGTSLHDTCTDRGNATTYTYDYRNRQKTRVVQPNRSLTGGAAKLLTSTTTYTKNEVTSVTDEYGRRTHFVYASADPYLIRTVRETTPSGAAGTIATLARDASLNAKFVIEDMTVDAEGQALARVDGRNIEHTFAYDSRGRTTATVESARQWDDGTAQFVVTQIGAKTEFTYDAQGNRTQVKRPRSFQQQGDWSFVAGSEGDFITKYTYTGRNLAKSTTEAFGRSEAATESYTYYLDRRSKDRIDARGNTWTTLWSKCCGYHKVNAQPAADVDDNSGTAATRAAYVGNRDSRNLVVHQYTVPDWSLYPQDPTLPDSIYHDPTVTLNETTTRYDARMRPIASTQWFIDLGNVAKNDPPIAGDHGTNATDGLTTTWRYDENLTDGVGIDLDYATKLTQLGATYFGAGSVGSAVEVTNPNGEKSVTVYDGIGRVVLTIDGNGNTRRVVYDGVVGGTTGAQGNVVETTFYDGLSHTNKQRVDGVGRTLSTVDGEARVTAFSFDANSNRVKSRDPNSVGMDCVFDARNRQTQCTDTLSVDGTGAATGDVTAYSYDNHNNLKTTTDAKTHITICSYDGRDRKTACTDRVSGTTAWAYDANSNLLTLTDAQSSATTYVYDPRNLRVTETYPDTHSVTFAFDAAARMMRRTDQIPDNTLYVYDRLNRLIQRTYPDSLNDVFAYDNASRLTDATSGRYSNLVHRAYDAGGRMTSEASRRRSRTATSSRT
ncbi:MAG: RHS repeat protein [Planctomycetes bacterium]|nr:RHS repeat protein [Planctomycetota bacterium]